MDKFFKKLAKIRLRKASFRKLAVFCFIVLAGVLLFFSITRADGLEDVRNGIMGILIDWFIAFGEFCIKMTIFFLYFFIQLAKYNNYLDVPTVQLGWTMVRDVSNMFFVIVLLMISIGTILGLEQYQWNKTLVKLILAAVFINFSNLICGIFIDIAHVFTITFVNAVASTAGGNLIQMFSLNKMYDLILNKPIDASGKFDVRILVGAVSAFLFAFLAMITMAAYLIVMICRVVVLWVLIILSPIAFIAQVIPQTQTYAKEWWDKFGKQVAVAPVIVFFLWLAFATAGQGNLAAGPGSGMGLAMNPEAGSELIETTGGNAESNKLAVSWSSVTTWETMSNFLIPMALLFVGIGVVSKMGVVGGGAVAKATDFFKKAATIATGYAAGRWLAKKGWEGTKAVGGGLVKGAKAVGWYGIQGQRIKEWGQWQYASFQGWRKNAGWQPKARRDEAGNIMQVKDRDGKMKTVWETDKEGNVVMEYKKQEGVKGNVQRWLNQRVRKDVFSAKRLKRMQDFATQREELMSSYVSANPSHKFFMDKIERNGVMEARDENNKLLKDEKGEQIYLKTDISRFEMGLKEQNKARSEMKTKEHAAYGRKAAGLAERLQFIPKGTIFIEWAKNEIQTPITEQMAEHEIRMERSEAALDEGKKQHRAEYAAGEGKGIVESREAIKKRAEEYRGREEEAEKAATNKFARGNPELMEAIAGHKVEIEKAGGELKAEETEALLRYANEHMELYEEITGHKKREEMAKGGVEVVENEAMREFALANPDVLEVITGYKKRVEEAKGEVTAEEAKVLHGYAEANPGLYEAIMGHKKEEEVEKGKEEILTKEAERRVLERELPGGGQLIDALNRIEIGKKAADDFVKQLKDENLSKAFGEATDNLKKLMEKGLNVNQLKQVLAEGFFVNEVGQRENVMLGQYERALSSAEYATIEATTSDLRRRQAVDAASDTFVNKPLFGTTKPSTVTADYSEKNMGEYRRMERRAAMDKAIEIQSHLAELRDSGKELSIIQHAELHTATQFLNEEAWLDDGHENLRQRFLKIRKKQQKKEALTGGESALVNGYTKIGWLGKDKEGNIKLLESAKTYGRQEAQDMQNLGSTGADFDLVAAHKAVQKVVHEAMLKPENKNRDSNEVYNEMADGVLRTLGMDGLKDSQGLRKRFALSEDFLQASARTSVKSGVNTGHGELMYNQNYDDKMKTHRFMTLDEAKGETIAEFRKYKPRDLLSKFQYHHYGQLDQKTGMVDDFIMSMLSNTLGRAERAYDLTNTNDRALNSWFYLHKEEKMKTTKRKEDVVEWDKKTKKTAKVNKDVVYAVLGGDKIHEKLKEEFEEEDVANTPENQEKHMLANGVMKCLLAGAEGWFLGLSKLGKHIDENQAKQGIINIDVVGEKYKTASELIERLLTLAVKDKNYFLQQLENSDYEGNLDKAVKELQQLRDDYKVKERNYDPSKPITPSPEEQAQSSDGGGQI